MAFITTPAGACYFSIYYYMEPQERISGTFHKLSPAQSLFLRKAWSWVAAIAAALLLSQLILYFLYRAGSTGLISEAWKFYLLATPVIILPLAMYIAPKQSILLTSERAKVERWPSACVYIAVIGLLCTMNISFIWMREAGIPVPGVSAFILGFSLASGFCLHRILMLYRPA